jgi:Holliday junction resolvasome RuvABC endonuclease subunit
MKLLAFDLANKAGFAVFNNKELITAGNISFDFTRDKDWLELQYFTENLVKQQEVDIIVQESPFINPYRPQASFVLIQLSGALKLVAISCGIKHLGISAKEIKKYVGGDGRATKDHVNKIVNKLYGTMIKSMDESDAVATGLAQILKFSEVKEVKKV